MSLPFSTEAFYGVFGRYNEAVWPAQVLLLAMALTCVAAVSFMPALVSNTPSKGEVSCRTLPLSQP